MHRFRILYLDNNCFIANQVKMRLEWKGYQITITDNEQELIQKIQGQECELLIIDYLTPALHAFALLEGLKQQNLMPATIVVSEREDHERAVRLKQLGCMAYVVKNNLIQRYFDQISLSIFQVFEQLECDKVGTESQQAISCHPGNISFSRATATWEYFPAQDMVQCSLPGCGAKVVLSYDEFMAKIHFEDLAHVKTQNNICLFSHEDVEYSFRYLADTGVISTFQAQIRAELDSEGIVGRLYGGVKILATQSLVDQNQHIKLSFLDRATDAFFIADVRQHIIAINDAFTTICGYSEQEVLNKEVSLLNTAQFDQGFYKQVAEKLKHNNFWQDEVLVCHQNGSAIPVWLSCHVLKDGTGNIFQTISVLRDITKQKVYEETIKFQANYDLLTQLPNRSLFLDRFASAIKLSKRHHSKLALMILDLNKFKWINDSLGHHAGDLLLQETAKKLLSAVRRSDTVARLGGDEFAIIVSEQEKTTDAELIVRKIFNAFKSPVLIEQQEIVISGCIGITIFPEDGTSLEVLQQNADSAMYMAKKNRHSDYCYYTQAIQEETEKRLTLIEDMRQAILNREFSLHYQPIINVTSNKVDSAEALLRWEHPQLGDMPLYTFIPAAEECGLIQEIGNWVLEEVASHIQRWSDLGFAPLPISLNQSVAQYQASECHSGWLKILQNKQIAPNRITFEIPEKIFLQKKVHHLQSIEKLKQEGIQISLDGFGTGYSSLNYLKEFPVDVIKIDRSYIHSMVDDPVNAILVETIIILANKLDIKVIATGIETEEQLGMLNRQCCYAQGHYFSKPLPLNEFEAFLCARNECS